MAHVKKAPTGWMVRWKELVTTLEDGQVCRRWKERSRTFPLKKDAEAFERDIETASARGQRFVDKREQAIVTVHALCLAYVRAAVDAGLPEPTQRWRSSMIGSFSDWVGEELLVDELSLVLLQQYANSLPSDGRKASTRHRKVAIVEQLWEWAHDRPELYPGVPAPRRYTGGPSESDKLRAPPPVIAVGAPTWADLDAMIDELSRPGGARRRTAAAPAEPAKKPRGRPPPAWHRKIALLLRYTGLRASQACGLDWRDVDLDNGVLRVRAAVRGSKKGRTRVIPLHPALVAEMAAWGVRDGPVFPRWYKKGGQLQTGPFRGDALVEPFRGAWERAGVSPDKWAVPDGDEIEGERAKASPTHAIRRCVRTELLRAGIEEAVVLYFVGQAQGVTAAAYVPENSPEQSPYWPKLLAAVAAIPDHRDRKVARMVKR